MPHPNQPAHFEQIPHFPNLLERVQPKSGSTPPPWLEAQDTDFVEIDNLRTLESFDDSAPWGDLPDLAGPDRHESFPPIGLAQPESVSPPPPVKKYDIVFQPTQSGRPLSEIQFITEPQPISIFQIQLARSRVGTTEVVLNSVRKFDVHDHYVLQINRRKEKNSQQTIPLIDVVEQKKKRGQATAPPPISTPLTLEQAKIIFDEAVKNEFPPIEHRPGFFVPVHEMFEAKK